MYRLSGRRRRGNLSSTPSLTSIDSIKDESLSNPSTLQECDDQLDSYQTLLKSKAQNLASLSEQLRDLRSQKEPLLRIKETLHEEIAKSNQAINAKSEEVTQLKNKLRHHSERQIQDNIERLEFQLRNNNYKPREEQKILDEICMLRRSFKTLKEFELKQRENKKYRSERYRLIEQRNEVFSKMQTIILLEDEVRQGISENKDTINSLKNSIDIVKKMRPEFEIAYFTEQKMKEEVRLKKLEEKSRARKEQYLKRQDERQKRWEEYEASREPYEDEKDLCKILLSYVQASVPCQAFVENSVKALIPTKENSKSPDTADKILLKDDSIAGVFYCKPKDELPSAMRKNKKSKAKSKKEQKALRIITLPHPPEVINNFDKLNIGLPKTTEDIPAAIEALNAKLEHLNILGKNAIKEAIVEKKKNNEIDVQLPTHNEVNGHPKNTSKTFKSNEENIASQTQYSINLNSSFKLPISSERKVFSAGQHMNKSAKSILLSNPNASKSFFSIPVPVFTNGQSNSNVDSDLPLTYASVTAKIGI